MWRNHLHCLLFLSVCACAHTATPVCVLPGEFMMGSPPSEPGRGADETAHRVRITRPFLMDATEVTTLDWATHMGSAPVPRDPCEGGCPVSLVSWYDTLAYVNARSQRDGLTPCYMLEGCAGTPG